MPQEMILKMSKTLGDETRLAVFRHLVTCGHPVTVAEVAAHFSLHPNAARSHLARLEQAELAISAPDHGTGSGRPPRVYRPAGQGFGPIFAPTTFRALALLLLDLVAELPGLDAERLGEFGRRWGQAHAARWRAEQAPTTAGDRGPTVQGRGEAVQVTDEFILAGLVRTLETWGFAALLGSDEAGGPPCRVEIRRCAFADVLARHGERICPLIHGVLEGLLVSVRPDRGFVVQRGAGEPPSCCTMRLGTRPPGQ